MVIVSGNPHTRRGASTASSSIPVTNAKAAAIDQTNPRDVVPKATRTRTGTTRNSQEPAPRHASNATRTMRRASSCPTLRLEALGAR